MKKKKITVSYIKDEHGKTVDVYLDLASYKAFIKKVKTAEKNLKAVSGKKSSNKKSC